MGHGASVLADKYDEEEFERLNQRFREAAAEGSFRGKTIDKKTFLKRFFPKIDKDIGGRFFDTFDASGNGKVDWEEFATGVFICTRGTLQEKMRLIFKLFDSDHNNSISQKEMKTMLQKSFFSDSRKNASGTIVRHQTVDQLVAEAFKTYDKNHDGVLSEAEFVEWAMTSYDIRMLINKFGDWERLYRRSEEGISGPTSIEHLVHLDKQGNYAIKTLPPEWIALFKEAGVTKKEANDPEVVKTLVNILLDHIPSSNLPPGLDLTRPPALPPRPLAESFDDLNVSAGPVPHYPAPPPPPSVPAPEIPDSSSSSSAPPSAPAPPPAPVPPPAPSLDSGAPKFPSAPKPSGPPAPSLMDQLKQKPSLSHVEPTEKRSSGSSSDLLQDIRKGANLRHVDLSEIKIAKTEEERNDLTSVLKRALASMRYSVANTDDPDPRYGDADDDW